MARIPNANRLRMRQLIQATGVPKGTIQFYIKEGLVPRPIKTHPNMAYYDQTHMDAIRQIRELQQKRFLPLAVIKRVMGGGKDELSIDELRTLVEMDGKLFGNLKEMPRVKPVTARKLSRRTGVSDKEIRELEKHGILRPVRKGKTAVYDEDDIRLVECWARLRAAGYSRELGFDPSVLKIFLEPLDHLVEEEGRILTTRVTGKVPLQKVVKMVEEGTAILNAIIGVIHKRLIVETVRRYAEEFQDKVLASG